MRIPRLKSSRKGVAGIIAAVLLFAMLFTVGAGYFLYVTQANTVYTNALLTRAGGISSQAEEALTLTSGLTSGGHIDVYVNNTGGIGVNITSLYLLSPSGSTLECLGVGLPAGCTNGAPFPMLINVGGGSGTIDTGYPPASGDIYTIKLVTQRGTVFSTTYPTAATSLAARALSSGAIGDLYLSLGTYAYFAVLSNSSSDCPTSGSAVSGGTSSGYCLEAPQVSGCTSIGIGCSAYVVPHNFAPDIAFSVEVTNLNPNQLTITLDPYSLINQVIEHGSGAVKYQIWYVVSNDSSNVILSTYTPISLAYDKPTVVVFAALNAMSSGTPFAGEGLPTMAEYSTAPVFIVSHGWKGLSMPQPESAANYGQNSPYVTTLYD